MIKRAGDVTTVALDFSPLLAPGERIHEVVAVSVWAKREAYVETVPLQKGDRVSYTITKVDGSASSVTVDTEGEELYIAIRSSREEVPMSELYREWGIGQAPQDKMVLVTLGKYDPLSRVVSSGGLPGRTYIIQATVRKEFGDVVSKEAEVSVTL